MKTWFAGKKLSSNNFGGVKEVAEILGKMNRPRKKFEKTYVFIPNTNIY